MNEKSTDKQRRVLTIATLAGAGVATAGAAFPFAASFEPSRRTKGEGAPVQIDISGLEPGKLHVVPWRRKPVWIQIRTQEMIQSLENVSDLQDPESESSVQPVNCKNPTRSIKPEIFVALGVCTHLGCSPGSNQEGFLCACHGSYFDYAGRVLSGSPAPRNLDIPEHYYASDSVLIVGESSTA